MRRSNRARRARSRSTLAWVLRCRRHGLRGGHHATARGAPSISCCQARCRNREYLRRRSTVDALRHRPGDVGDEAGAASGFDGIRARGIALQRSGQHAVQDRGDPEHVENEVDVPVRIASRPVRRQYAATYSASVGMPSAAKSQPLRPRNSRGARRHAITWYAKSDSGCPRSTIPSPAPQARGARWDGRSRCRYGSRRGRARFRPQVARAAAAIR